MKTQFLLATTALFGCLTGYTQDTTALNTPTTQNTPTMQNGRGVYVTADFILWKITLDGLNYAKTGVRETKGTTLKTQGSEHTPNFSWEPGYKIGLGFKLPHDYWDLYFQHTWIQSLGNKSSASSEDKNMLSGFCLGPLTTSSLTETSIKKASTSWDAHLNVLDLELGRCFTISDSFLLRPFGGLKAVWLDQEWKNEFIGTIRIDSGSPKPGMITSNQDHYSWGLGIRTGLNGQWSFTSHWGLFANTALSALGTDYDVTRKDIFKEDSAPSGVTGIDLGRGNYGVKGLVELLLGIKAQWWPSNGRCHIALHIAYEQQVWINYGNYIFFCDTNNDLTMHGLNASFRIDF